jgi:hypothetical protein
MRSMTLRLLLCLCCLLMAGCSRTVFESIPTGASSECDRRLVGTWRTGEWGLDGAEEAVDEEDAHYVVVTPACEILDWYTRRTPSDLRDLPTLRFVADKGNAYAYFPDSLGDDEDSDEHAPAASGTPWARGYVLFRYVVDEDRIAVYPVDDRRVAGLIRRKLIPGGRSVLASGDGSDRASGEDPEFQNFVPGSSAKISGLLKAHPDIFRSRPMGILHRYRGTPPARRDRSGRRGR